MSEIVKSENKPSAIEIAFKQKCLKGLKPTEITEVISGMTGSFKSALVNSIKPETFATMVTTIFDRNPDLKECTINSLFGAMQQTAILGLEPAPALGHCYYVPYNTSKTINGVKQWVKEVQFQIGYKGYLELARRSAEISDIYAEVVYEGDDFELDYGLNRNLSHKPRFLNDEHEHIKYAYAVAKFKDGTSTFAVLTKKQLEKRRKMSPNQKSYSAKTRIASEVPLGIWESNYAEMAKGKAIRALATYLPLSTQDKQRLVLPEAQVIRRELQAPIQEFTVEEYQRDTEYEDDYNVDIETGEIQAADNNNILNMINEDAKV